MNKKNLVIVFLVIVIVGVFGYPKIFPADAVVPLSDVSANPSSFLGDLTISGVTGPVFEDKGGFILLDEKGCCQINILVPFTEEQKTALSLDAVYSGKMPAQGEAIEVTGTLKREGAYYLFDVEKVTRQKDTIIEKM